MPPGRKHFAARLDRQAKFLELKAQGLTHQQCAERLGLHLNTISKWRHRYPEFAVELDVIRGMPAKNGRIDPGTFTGFRLRYFGLETYRHHARIIHEIESARKGEVVLILVPPEAGKTTLLEDYANFRIAKDPNFRITLVSEGQPHARKILGRVQRRMIDHDVAPEYIADFGPFRTSRSEAMGKRWSVDLFTVALSNHDERDYTMEARGWTSRIAGTRTDLLLIDDIQSRVSLDQTEKMVGVFRQDMLTRPGRSAPIIIVGTRVGNLDFYEAIMSEGIVDKVVIISAVDHKGASYCPEMWPIEDLNIRRTKVGEDVWWRTYMQKPRLGGASTFALDLLDEAKDLSRPWGKVPDGAQVLIGLDPAVTNWNAFVTCAMNAEGLHLVDVRRDRALGSTENILAKLDVLATQYRPEIVVVEQNSYQKGLVNDERLRSLSRQHGFVITPHTTGKNKLDEQLGVSRMPTSFVKGLVHIPWADERAHEVFGPFIEELHNWRHDVPTRKLRQDMVMAFWFCWLEWQRRVPSLESGTSSWKRKGLPWRPSGNPLRGARKAS